MHPSPRTTPRRRTLSRALILAAATAAAPLSPARADRHYTGINPGLWSSPVNWDYPGPPVPNEAAYLDSYYSATVIFDYNYTSPLSKLVISGSSPSVTLALSHSANTLRTNSLLMGNGGAAAYSLSANGILITNGSETFGNTASPAAISFTQSGGVHSLSGTFGALNLAYAAGSTASYSLSAGNLTLSPDTLGEYVGYQGAATFSQSGGTHNVAGSYFSIGSGATSNGTYNLTGGTLNVFGIEWVGDQGRGTFTHSAGAHTIGSPTGATGLIVGGAPGATGSYALTGPTASLQVYGAVTLGSDGTGSLAQSAGTVTVSSNVELGLTPKGTGSYALAGGSFSAPTLTIGVSGAGSLTHSAGVASVPTLTLAAAAGSSASYSLSGTASLSTTTESIGLSGTAATFTQSGGTHTTSSSATLGALANSAGRYDLSGGTHSVPTLRLAYGPNSTASYNLTGGTLAVSSLLTVGDGGASASVTHSAGSLSAPILRLSSVALSTATYSLSGTGSLAAPTQSVGVNGPATFTQSGGTNTAATSLTLGEMDNSSGTYLLSAGSLTAFNLRVGSRGAGSFSQTGGSVTVTGDALTLAPFHAASASYRLAGGTLTAPAATVGVPDLDPGHAASLTIAGGSASINTLTVASAPGASLNLDGGSLSVRSLDLAGNPTAHFHWSAGTLSFSTGYVVNSAFPLTDTFTLAPNQTLSSPAPAYNNGSLQLAGGSLAGTGTLTNSSLLSGFGTLAQPLANTALLTQAGGNLTIAAPLTNSPSGTVTLEPGRITTLTATLTNTGTLNLNNATITGGGAGTVANSLGGLLAGPGTVAAPSFSNAGTLLVPAGQTRTPSFTNAGIVQLDSLAANLAPAGTLTNAGTLEGHGRVSATLVANTATGTIEPTGGTLTLAAPLTNAPSATIRIAAGNKLLVTSPVTNAGTLLLTGGTLDTSNQSLTNTGTLAAAAGLSTIAAPLTNTNASKVLITGNATAVFSSPVTNLSGSEFRISPGSTAVFLAPVSGQTQFTGSGSKFFESGASAPSAIDTNGLGTTTVQPSASLTTSYLNESSLTASGPITLIPNSPPSTLSALDLTTTGTLDLTNDTLTLTNTPASTPRSYLLSHQLFSSLSDSTHSLGYIPGLLVRLTLTGDANLDGQITPDDYALLDKGFATHASTWWNGDFNYDGAVDTSDYLLIDTTLGQAQGFSPRFLAQRQSQFGTQYVQQLLTSIPEPSPLLAAFGLALPLLLRRRKNQT